MVLATLEMSPRPYRLRPRQDRAAIALIEAAAPPGEVIVEGVDHAQVREGLEHLLGAMPRPTRMVVLGALAVFEWSAVFRCFRRFSRLDPERRGRRVVAWNRSRHAAPRLVMRLLLTVLKPLHARRRSLQRRIGYEPDRLDHLEPPPRVALPPGRVLTSIEADTELRCQVAVVGSGAGGAVLAAELAERGVDVVIVEEGLLPRPSELGRDPVDNLTGLYRDGGATFALGRPGMPVPIGRTVGGTTTVNSGTCFRVPERVLARWDELGVKLDRAALDRACSRVEERISVREVPPELLGGSSHVVARGSAALGLRHGPLERNIRDCKATAVCAFGCPRDGKQAMHVTYVPRAVLAGARLFAGFRAARVLVEGGRAAGVLARPAGGGPALTVRADRVVSACGSVPGVPFLRASGLRSRHLGRHLSLHPAAKILALMPEPVRGWRDTPQGYGIFELEEQGILFEGAFVPPEYASITIPFAGRDFTALMEQYARLAIFGFMVSDEPRGRVRVLPGGLPLMTYDISRGDLEKVRTGLKLLARVFFAAGAERIYLPVAGAEEQRGLRSALAALERPLDPWGVELVAFHPLGTARMAARRRDGVVDPELRSWEIPGLRVVDGGVFPSSLGVNPQLAIMALATLAAESLAAELGA